MYPKPAYKVQPSVRNGTGDGAIRAMASLLQQSAVMPITRYGLQRQFLKEV